jgi:hypothetical protein
MQSIELILKMRIRAQANSRASEAAAGEASAKIAQKAAQAFCPSGNVARWGLQFLVAVSARLSRPLLPVMWAPSDDTR